jgi:hypothetical protein
MILLAVAWFYYSALFFLLGLGLVRFVGRLTKETPLPDAGFLVWFGIALTSVSVTLWHFFLPVGGALHIVLLLFSGLSLLGRGTALAREALRELFSDWPWWLVAPAVFISIVILFVSTDAPVYNLDPGRYHFQSLLWTQSFPLVPGLTNLHVRFGTGSSWYGIHALAEIGPFRERSYHIFNGLLFAYFMLSAVKGVRRLVRGLWTYADGFVVCFGLYLAWYYDLLRYLFLSCLTPDLATSLFSAVCFLFLLTHGWSQAAKCLPPLSTWVLYAILASQAFALRISGIYALGGLLVLARRLIGSRDLRTWVLAASVPFVLVLPTLAKNVILTGWLLFPKPVFDWFDVDWKYPAESARALTSTIAHAGFLEGLPQDALAEQAEINSQPFLTLLGGWLKSQLLGGGVLYWPLIGGALALCARLAARSRGAPWPIGTVVLAWGILGAWMSTTTYFRYGFANLGIAFATSAAVALGARDIQARRVSLWILRACLLMVGCATVLNFALKSSGASLRQSRLLYPVEFTRYILAHSKAFELTGVPSPTYITRPLPPGVINIVQRDMSYTTWGRNKAYETRFFDVATTDERGVQRPSAEASYNADVSTLLWLSPLPSVAALVEGTERRGPALSDGFRARK